MPYRKEAKDCFKCRNANVFYSKAGLRIYIVCRIPSVLSGALRRESLDRA